MQFFESPGGPNSRLNSPNPAPRPVQIAVLGLCQAQRCDLAAKLAADRVWEGLGLNHSFWGLRNLSGTDAQPGAWNEYTPTDCLARINTKPEGASIAVLQNGMLGRESPGGWRMDRETGSLSPADTGRVKMNGDKQR